MSLEERVASVQKELQTLEEHLKEQADYKKQYEELKAELLRLPTEAHVKQVEDDMAQLKEDMEELRSDGKAKAEEIIRLGKVVNDYQQEIESLRLKLSEANASQQGFKDFLAPIVAELIEGEKLVTELMKPQTQSYTSTKTVADLTLEVVRQPLVLDMKTTRGQVLALITDGFFNKFTSIPKVLKELQNQFVNVKREELEKELAWYVQESIIHHTVSASGTHTYQLRADAKDRVRKVVKEPSG